MYSTPLISFYWSVGLSGHAPVIIRNQGYLIRNTTQEFRNKYETDYKTVLTDFINIPEDNLINKMIEFANKYGLLTKGNTISEIFNHDPQTFSIFSCKPDGISLKEEHALPIINNDITCSVAEPFELWFSAYHELKTIVRAWENIERRKVKLNDPSWRYPTKLNQGIEITWQYKINQAYQYRFKYGSSPQISGKIGSKEGLTKDLFQKNDTLGPATFALQYEINQKLDKYPCRFHIMYDARSTKKPKLAYQAIPINLLGMLWLQVAQLVCGERTFMRCEFCHQYEDITGSRIKKNVHPWCSGTNRKKQSRQKYDDKIYKAYMASGSIDIVAEQFNETPRKIKAVIKKKEADKNAK